MAKFPATDTSSNQPSGSVGGYLEVLGQLETRQTPPQQPGAAPTPKIDINDELARRERIRNDDAEQDIALKKQTLNRLFWFLGIETGLIFVFTFLQATGYLRFSLEEWSFKVLVAATIAQITAMLYVAVTYLFPKNRRG
jgi:hypothetical protein